MPDRVFFMLPLLPVPVVGNHFRLFITSLFTHKKNCQQRSGVEFTCADEKRLIRAELLLEFVLSEFLFVFFS